MICWKCICWFVDNCCAMTKINGRSVLKINCNSWVKRVGNPNRKKYCRVKEIFETVVSLVVVGVGGDRGGGGVIIDWMTLLISGWIGIIIESKLVGRLKGRGFRRVDGEDMMVAGKTAVIDSWKNMMVAGRICWRQGHVGGWAKWPANSEIRVGGWLMWECFKGHCKKVVNIQRLEIDENVVLLGELVVTVVEVGSF